MALANQIDFSANRKEPPKPPAWMTLGLVGADFLSEIETSDGKDEGRGGKGGKGGDTRGGDAGGGLPWWTAWVEGLRLRASAAAEGIRLLDGGGLIDVMEQLDEESKGLVPIAHVRTLMPAILSNLRSAGFDAIESNVLVRLLYSWSDELHGAAHRHAAWRLLHDGRRRLRFAADRLASEVGEFRTQGQQYRLSSTEHALAAAARGKGGGAASDGPSGPDGLSEDELQFVVCVLGEHLTDAQLTAIFAAAAAHFDDEIAAGVDGSVLPFDSGGDALDVGRIIRYMNPRLHKNEGGEAGSIRENEDRAKELQAQEIDLVEAASRGAAGSTFGVVVERSLSALTKGVARGLAKVLPQGGGRKRGEEEEEEEVVGEDDLHKVRFHAAREMRISLVHMAWHVSGGRRGQGISHLPGGAEEVSARRAARAVRLDRVSRDRG